MHVSARCAAWAAMPKVKKGIFMATMDDIARELGITKGTVSKALSGADDVSETTRKSVLEKAVELGYSRVFRKADSQRMCIFVENMAYEQPEDFGRDIIMGFRKMAEPLGYTVDVVALNMELQGGISYDQYMLKNDYRGGVFLGFTPLDPWMKDFETCRTPAVLYDNHISGNPAVTYIGIDNEEGMRMAVSRLKALGHQKIGYLSSALGSHVYQQRYRAFFRALHENKLEDKRSFAASSYYTSECLSRHLPHLLEQGCTAIICSHDMLASSVMIHCGELGLRIPQDVSIVGFDDIPLCRYTTPPLSSVRQNRMELGRSAFYALSSQINQIPISTLLLHAELIERESMGPAKGAEPSSQGPAQ